MRQQPQRLLPVELLLRIAGELLVQDNSGVPDDAHRLLETGRALAQASRGLLSAARSVLYDSCVVDVSQDAKAGDQARRLALALASRGPHVRFVRQLVLKPASAIDESLAQSVFSNVAPTLRSIDLTARPLGSALAILRGYEWPALAHVSLSISEAADVRLVDVLRELPLLCSLRLVGAPGADVAMLWDEDAAFPRVRTLALEHVGADLERLVVQSCPLSSLSLVGTPCERLDALDLSAGVDGAPPEIRELELTPADDAVKLQPGAPPGLALKRLLARLPMLQRVHLAARPGSAFDSVSLATFLRAVSPDVREIEASTQVSNARVAFALSSALQRWLANAQRQQLPTLASVKLSLVLEDSATPAEHARWPARVEDVHHTLEQACSLNGIAFCLST